MFALKMPKQTFRCSYEVWGQIVKLASQWTVPGRRRYTPSDVVREAVIEFLAKHGKEIK